ncbi:MAG TPA: cytochrome C, partial [Bryobacteraceae bacterium]
AFEKFYQDKYPQVWLEHRKDVVAAGRVVLVLWSRNIFPDMKVTWGTYPNDLGHTDSPGCFRCHDGAHMARTGESITQDCDACHSLLAADEAHPKILTDLGLAEAKQ